MADVSLPMAVALFRATGPAMNVAVAFDPSGRLAITANSMSESLTVVRVHELSKVATIALGKAPTSALPPKKMEFADKLKR